MKYRRGARGVGTVGSHPTGVRGLKCQAIHALAHANQVAPHWGAWIEIVFTRASQTYGDSRTPLGCVD